MDGVDQPLRPREFDLLALLASEPDRLFTKEELLREVWEYPEGVSTRTLETHVTNTCRKLRQAGLEGFIVNYRGIGYKLCEGAAIDVECVPPGFDSRVPTLLSRPPNLGRNAVPSLAGSFISTSGAQPTNRCSGYTVSPWERRQERPGTTRCRGWRPPTPGTASG